MAESKNSFIRSKMNKDLDERLIPNNEYRDAHNIAISRSEGSDVGALEAILGNERIYQNAAGLEAIGFYVDETNGYVYYMLTNWNGEGEIPSTAICQVCRYSPSSNSHLILVGGPTAGDGRFLNFSTASHIYGINLIEELLFWTDNLNQPRKINVRTASSNPGAAGYYQTEQSISVCKYSPFLAPAVIDLRVQAVQYDLPSSVISPSTMSDAEDQPYVRIDLIDWTTENLSVARYRNGDEISQAITPSQWTDFNAAGTGAWCYYDFELANGVTYGKLYNKYAVEDARNLAPYGYSLATDADYTALLLGNGGSGDVDSALALKSINLWTNPGNNSSGFDGLPAGEVSAAGIFSNIGADAVDTATFWTSDTSDDYLTLPTVNATGAVLTNGGSTAADMGVGRSIRLTRNATFKGWQGDPELLKDKFVRFSYRFKFDDDEYSLIAPFTQECFIPQQDGQFVNKDEEDAFRTTIVEFMQNSINNIILNIELPSLDIITDYKVKEIEIVFKESDALDYKILQNVPVNASFIANLNNTTIYQYTYQSILPYKTLPVDETTRVYDKVPVRALAQEIVANRVMYANFTQSYDEPIGLDYYVEKSDKDVQIQEEYPQHSVKQNRNYQVGIVLADKWGRQSDVILSSKDNVLVAGGQPIEGSNYFTTYKPISFAGSVDSWNGQELNLIFDSIITSPTSDGLYANPNNYIVEEPYSSPWPGFLNWSTQEIATVAAQAAYTFTNLSQSDLDATTLFTLWLNTGTGWSLVDATTYGVTASGADGIIVTFTSGAPATTGYKLRGRVLYNAQYRYEIDYIPAASDPTTTIASTDLASSITTNTGDGTPASTHYNPSAWTTSGEGIDLVIDVVVLASKVSEINVITPGSKFNVGDTITIPTTTIGGTTDVVVTLTEADMVPGASGIFNTGKFLRGKYTDYVKIQSLSQIGSVNKYYFYTNKEIADNYMWQGDTTVTSNPSVRTEPFTDENVNNSTYDLNQLGWYSYRVVIKQQEQEYYNVYLPGIINGYPSTPPSSLPPPLELDEVAFCVLVHDNINKVPRDLSDVAAQDVQYNSGVTWFGRVENNDRANSYNTQYIPTTNPDSVSLLGTSTNLFPEMDYDGQAGNVNPYAVFDVDQRPVMAKIDTQNTIGLVEGTFVAPVAGSEYPRAMGLSVYETSPTISQLELFWESSTSGLISDLNTAVVTEGTKINGITDTDISIEEDDCAGTQISSVFFPTTPGGNDLTTTATLAVKEYNENGSINTGSDRSADFSLVQVTVGANQGGYYLRLDNPQSCTPDTYPWTQHYWFEITFTQADSTVAIQTIGNSSTALMNKDPLVELGLSPNVDVTDTVILRPHSTFNGLGTNAGFVKGWNGSCNDCESTSNLKWVIFSINIEDVNGGATISGGATGNAATASDIDYYFHTANDGVIPAGFDCANVPPDNYWGVELRRRSTYNWNPVQHTLNLRLYDTNGSEAYKDLEIIFTPTDIRYDGSVVYSYYPNYSAAAGFEQSTSLTQMGPGCQNPGVPVKPHFVGEVQNWKDTAQHIWIYTNSTATTGSTTLSWTAGGTNTGATNSPANGSGAVGWLSGSFPNVNVYDATNPWAGAYVELAKLEAFDPPAAQINAGVTPGDKGNLDGVDYDWSKCVMVNLSLPVDPIECGEGQTLTLKYSPGNTPPVAYNNVQQINPTTPPVIGTSYPFSGPWPGA